MHVQMSDFFETFGSYTILPWIKLSGFIPAFNDRSWYISFTLIKISSYFHNLFDLFFLPLIRFLPENRALHHPLQWIPFGYGPRNCIGMRLALLEIRIALVYLFQRYRFVPNSKTVGVNSPNKCHMNEFSNYISGIYLDVRTDGRTLFQN